MDVNLEDLGPEETMDLLIEQLTEATDWVKDVKPKENRVALMELLLNSLSILDYYLELKEYEILDLDFDTSNTRAN